MYFLHFFPILVHLMHLIKEEVQRDLEFLGWLQSSNFLGHGTWSGNHIMNFSGQMHQIFFKAWYITEAWVSYQNLDFPFINNNCVKGHSMIPASSISRNPLRGSKPTKLEPIPIFH